MRTPRLLVLLLVLALALAPAAAAFVKPPQARAEAKTVRHVPLGKRVVRYARNLVGVPYRYGGGSPRSGFDCSGLVRYVYGHFGISLAHSSFAQFGRGRLVVRRALKPGDLVFFAGAGHVGIYVGHGRFIHAPHTGAVVSVDRLTGWYSSSFDGARRLHPA